MMKNVADDYLPAVLEFLNKAGAEALRIQATAAQQIKEDRSLVTAADLAISKMFSELIKSFPNAEKHFVIDEEDCGTVSAAKDKIEKADFVWTIDPIDGTAPYAHGLPHWGIMVSLYQYSKPIFGVIFLPALDELVYSDGLNAYHINKKTSVKTSLSTLPPKPLHPSSIVMAASWMADFDTDPVLVMDVHAAAAYAVYALLGRARASFFGSPMKIWDAAPAIAIAKHVGLQMINTRTGTVLETLNMNILFDNWKLKDIHVLCHPSQFEELRKLPKSVR